ncbi:hypothetical protein [Tengunoibacter tsumagoiensis]|uniref:Uncharacterized protein n=1 Tax=Tengunoibacter tsumagoiensis TaxID=2014871 RepID=A0A401ZU69_9CHLR|nr:hypothetical protein [Tengunoibacter tsumagoiensis]GCE10439.1 hypothetical protein KTT_02980 [Tengunoibacter tsumagoiensis]
MQRTRKTSFTPGLRNFISKIITPAVLVAGMLLLIIVNFNGVLKTTKTDENHFHNVVAFSQGALSLSFKQLSGTERPLVTYGGHEVLNLAQWSSSISVDGTITGLWNVDQGYSVDEAHNRIYSTMTSKDGWQVIQTTTLIDDHTITVAYSFSASPQDNVPPEKYVLSIAHVHNYWYNPQFGGDAFTGYVMNTLNGEGLQGDEAQNQAASLGQVKVAVSAGDVAPPKFVPGSMNIAATADGKGASWTKSFTTEYTIEHPAPSRVINLGTETITFSSIDQTGKPIGGPVMITPDASKSANK